MKKNKMMRLASAMMVMTLMTTSVISGTFAKYVTSDEGSDTARVAKFGVTVTKDGYLFSDSYLNEPTEYDEDETGAAITVQADSEGTNVVAPGTESTDAGLTFAITGTPEVDVELSIEVSDYADDIFLKDVDGLPNMTTTADDDTLELSEDYYPVKYTLWQKTSDDDAFNPVEGAEDVNLSVLATKLAGLSVERYDANTDLAKEVGTLKITWKWDFEVNDAADTLLGNLAANEDEVDDLLPDGAEYGLNTGLTVTVKVTQLD